MHVCNDSQTDCVTDVLYFNCDFEQDLCGWKNVPIPSDSFDWTRKQGPTWTGGTGPSTDHTKQTGTLMINALNIVQ